MGLFDPSVNLEKEQKMLKKNNPYTGLFCSVKFSFSNILIKRTVFRIAEKGVVIAQGNDDDTDMRIHGMILKIADGMMKLSFIL